MFNKNTPVKNEEKNKTKMQNNYPIYERFCQINVTNTCGSESHTKECPKLNNKKKKRKAS